MLAAGGTGSLPLTEPSAGDDEGDCMTSRYVSAAAGCVLGFYSVSPPTHCLSCERQCCVNSLHADDTLF